MLDNIKNSKKEVHFNRYQDDKNIYSWIVYGDKLGDTDSIKTTINFGIKDKDKLDEMTNYANGVYLEFANTNFIEGVHARINVGNTYKDGDVLNVYVYDNDELKLIGSDFKVENNSINISPENSNYFVTKASFGKESPMTGEKKEKKTNVFMIFSIIELLIMNMVLNM